MEKPHDTGKLSLTGSALKWIAILSMFIDHTGAFLIEPYLLNHGIEIGSIFGGTSLSADSPYSVLFQIDIASRLIGRLAFPIFAFLLVEGFIHTRNLNRYIFQIGFFALLSEIPFDLAHAGTFLESSHQNIFFTLFIGLLCISFFDKLKGTYVSKWFILLIALVLSDFFNVDYSMVGLLTLFIFYYFHDDPILRNILNGSLFLLNLTAVFSLFLIQFYNGKRGKQIKLFFYIFYPAHLVLFYLIRNLPWFT
ncbi:TraX family protein [Lacticigenium naphthae]|uniref:TraX family protein n=1 Tax=Lacticigenium naphthae TaxID=515351 RepID=UPI0004064EFE|nr:TraX family protein [Lacticigenium naphthae]